MAWTKEQKMEKAVILSTGLFVWKRKSFYAFKNFQDFLESPEKFNEKLKPYMLSLGHEPSGGSGIFIMDIKVQFLTFVSVCYIEISETTENMKLCLKYKKNLRKWLPPDHYMLSDEQFDYMKDQLRKKSRRVK